MRVVGGAYLEICVYPKWRRLFGSGMRAAAAIAELSPKSGLTTYATSDLLPDIELTAQAFKIDLMTERAATSITFRYFHPLSSPIIEPVCYEQAKALNVAEDVVLRFGMLEGEAIVDAGVAVYDPQAGTAYAPFRANGSRADRLAIVLNEWEARLATGLPPWEAGTSLLEREQAEAVVVKMGPHGAWVLTPSAMPVRIPPHLSSKVFKIGSGDVFSAVFTHYWGEAGLDPIGAAKMASMAVAHYVETKHLPLPTLDTMRKSAALAFGERPRDVYLAGPFFTLAQRWLIEECRATFWTLNIPTFSPLHDVGTGGPARNLAEGDLKGLNGSAVVLALLDGADPGTLFEVGYARKAGIPVIALTETLAEENLTMFIGTDCEIETDFTTAIYKAAFKALSK